MAIGQRDMNMGALFVCFSNFVIIFLFATFRFPLAMLHIGLARRLAVRPHESTISYLQLASGIPLPAPPCDASLAKHDAALSHVGRSHVDRSVAWHSLP